MFEFRRSEENPILIPDSKNFWEAEATFNGCPVFDGKKIHFVYRALSPAGTSTIGYSKSKDGIHFEKHRQLLKPEYDWEKYGCEDPRVTKIGEKYYIFYTALSTFPFNADGIKAGLAVTKDFKTIKKYPVTPFNAKAMTLFPGKIKGKYVAILSVNTDNPPSQTCIAYFDKESDMWNPEYWKKWYEEKDYHEIPLFNHSADHVEIGAPPIKTKDGWLLLYSYIQNYFSGEKPVFGIEAMLLDLNNPKKVITKMRRPLLVPQEEYERYGMVPNIVFPSGAFVKRGKIYLYYGAADTVCAVAVGDLKELMKDLLATRIVQLERYSKNPIMKPLQKNPWEAKAVFNAGALYEDKKVHLFYRAMSSDNTSVVGYAQSTDGFKMKRFDKPAYVPREDFENKKVPNGNSGCEDARLTRMGDTVYMCYTAYNGIESPRVALTSVSFNNFKKQNWNWEKPILISRPNVDDKDAAIFPKKINGKYAILHRSNNQSIWIDFVDDLSFKNEKWLGGQILMSPREEYRDNKKIGINGPPIETKKGWLLLYHGLSKSDGKYHLWAALLDLKDPTKIIARSKNPILEAEMSYEKNGIVKNVVFSNGAVVKGDKLFVYYGGADEVLCVATIKLSKLLGCLDSKGACSFS
ncbi:TPA: hypothetical protein DCZ46_01420 [Candidatus Campbellbacteria bacterium]|nr:MAG: Glycosidase-related protein [Candidatus Campbellbacteria bacterium GW2011_OD1_34_28]KKP75256.1 MAG: Glycosidase-related protein [Candidatus Campbellbacteria bacterium GW2011_GWD2_35_24]KKP76183.1 MAG: Glycosidase-related protein [Candidatus Campbellbacteria bacterium GW2011_GWC2_35_28]KKP77372.1 MAG: Glycosidase-related protein [Candidatus Campbellbacteria bacterium GW2011_GWC1_35_31]KKP79301.1 MAG: Glycosidase-related protein [Candidatus Campbellbacteria bacterium GW2011_GWD1_35_49]HA